MNRIPELVQELQELANSHVEIGLLSGKAETEYLMIGGVNEFGATIERMGKNGPYTITIPERSYIRSGFDTHERDITDKLKLLLDGLLAGQTSAATVYDMIGVQVMDYLKEYLFALSEPPNAPSTIRQKGSSNPLMDTGKLKDSINYKVV